MAILFKTAIGEDKAQHLIETILHAGNHDGYLNVVTEETERADASQRGSHSDEFRHRVKEVLDDAKHSAPSWLIYQRSENDNAVSVNEMRNSAIQLTRGYSGTIVIALSLLGHDAGDQDLELLFICFREDFHRRNFRVRFEGKYIPDS
jgi:hypothetical protein